MTELPKYQDIIDLIEKGEISKAKEKIIQLKEGLIELQEENQKLKKELSEARKKILTYNKMEYDGSVYWVKKKGMKNKVPICPSCYDEEENEVILEAARDEDFEFLFWYCVVCMKQYYEN